MLTARKLERGKYGPVTDEVLYNAFPSRGFIFISRLNFRVSCFQVLQR